MRGLLLAFVLAASIAVAAFASLAAEPASAHQSRCHQAHICPSDHATYRWRGLLCVYKTADERNATFKRRVVYGGRVYFCKR